MVLRLLMNALLVPKPDRDELDVTLIELISAPVSSSAALVPVPGVSIADAVSDSSYGGENAAERTKSQPHKPGSVRMASKQRTLLVQSERPLLPRSPPSGQRF